MVEYMTKEFKKFFENVQWSYSKERKAKTRREPRLISYIGLWGFQHTFIKSNHNTFYITYRLGLENNRITDIENGSFANIPRVREIHLEHNKLKKIPSGLQELKYLQVKHSTCVW